MRFVDYKCNNCGSVSELVITGNNGCDIKCDKCGSKNMARIFTPIGFKSSSKSDDFASSGTSSGKSCSGGSCATCSGCN